MDAAGNRMLLLPGDELWIPKHVHADFDHAFRFRILRALYHGASGVCAVNGVELDGNRLPVLYRGFVIAPEDVAIVRLTSTDTHRRAVIRGRAEERSAH